ncbi:MAG: isoprenylcysteine carboxylmethyltransferase family protein [Nocardioides sp.]|nr:isoprenylcysteine carboxylmethyltransferase family protein [Nocardioides sp.]
MQGRLGDLVLSVAGWLGFLAVVGWTIAFLAGELVPRTVDGPVRIPTGPAIVVDLALLLLFAVQHSVMARQRVKLWLRRRVPERLERTTYIFATNACLILLLTFWQPWDGWVWQLDGPVAVVLWSLCAVGWLLAIVSTFAVDHLELTGLRQAGWGSPRDAHLDTLKVSGLYNIVRHPLMTGMLLAFWATPRMSVSHLLFAAASTGYIALGIYFEERDLRRMFGAAYDDYAASVPALLPGTVFARRAFGRRAAKA